MTQAALQSFFVGWDVGGWNCDNNSKSRDAIVILDDKGATIGTPRRANLRKCITEAHTTRAWLTALFTLCKVDPPHETATVTMAIDAPLGFPDDFVALITRRGHVEPSDASGRNSYLFRYTERYLYEKGLKPLSSIKDMIGSQATKGMHVLSKFAPKIESCGVWTDGNGFRAIETYPTAYRTALDVTKSPGNSDIDDARVCARMAYLFANERCNLDAPDADVPHSEGWIWVPKRQKQKL